MRIYWTNTRIEHSKAHTKSCSSTSSVKGLGWRTLPLHLYCLQHTSLSWGWCHFFIQPPLANISGPWHLKHLGLSSAIQVSQSEFYTQWPLRTSSPLNAFLEGLPCSMLPGLNSSFENLKEQSLIPSLLHPSCF